MFWLSFFADGFCLYWKYIYSHCTLEAIGTLFSKASGFESSVVCMAVLSVIPKKNGLSTTWIFSWNKKIFFRNSRLIHKMNFCFRYPQICWLCAFVLWYSTDSSWRVISGFTENQLYFAEISFPPLHRCSVWFYFFRNARSERGSSRALRIGLAMSRKWRCLSEENNKSWL